MARLVCPTHGEMDVVTHGGYSLGHSTGRDGPNELDLEGISFTFEVNNLTEDSIDLSLIESDAYGDYLSKFADWEEKVTRAAESEFEQYCGEEDCNEILFWGGDDEPLPWE